MYKDHLERLKERSDNVYDFLYSLFPLEGAELSSVNFFNSIGIPTSTWNGNGSLEFVIGIKEGIIPIDVLYEFSNKVRSAKFRTDMVKCELNNYNDLDHSLKNYYLDPFLFFYLIFQYLLSM